MTPWHQSVRIQFILKKLNAIFSETQACAPHFFHAGKYCWTWKRVSTSDCALKDKALASAKMHMENYQKTGDKCGEASCFEPLDGSLLANDCAKSAGKESKDIRPPA